MSFDTSKPDSSVSKSKVKLLEKKKEETETPLKRIIRIRGNVETKTDSMPNVSSNHSSNIPYDELNIDIRHKSSKIPRVVGSNSPNGYKDELVPLGKI